MIFSFELRDIVDIQYFSLLVVATALSRRVRLLKLFFVDFLINIHVFNIVQVVAEIVIDKVVGSRLLCMSHLDFGYLFRLRHDLNL
jgi:hypothetical protein